MKLSTWISTAAALVLTSVVTAGPPAVAPKKNTAPEADPTRLLALEVAALQLMHQLELTAAQLQALASLGKSTATPLGPQGKVKATPHFQSTLRELRDALVADDDDRIETLTEKLDKLFDTEKTEIEDRVPINEAARRLAPNFLRSLRPAQVADFLASLDEDDLDPVELLVDAVERGQSLGKGAWKDVRDDAADQAAWLLAGSDVRGAAQAQTLVGALLDQAHALSAEQFQARQANFEKQVQQLVGQLGPFDILRHVMERELAELLSNPRLPQAVQARLAVINKK